MGNDMNSLPTLATRLGQIATSGGGSQVVDVDLQHCRMELQVVTADALALAMDRIAFRWIADHALDPAGMTRIAEGIRNRVQYLSEPLRIVEFDRAAALVQMRSDKPWVQGTAQSYFEFLLSPTSIALQRWQAHPSSPRTLISVTLTRDILGRLADDIDRLVGEQF